jgi:hypothetical protein
MQNGRLTRFSLAFAAGLGFFSLFVPAGRTQTISPDYEEIVITFEVQRLIKTDMFVRYVGESIYLPFLETFGHLGISARADMQKELVYGFFGETDKRYELDLRRMTVRTFMGEFALAQADFSASDHELYLRLDRFAEFFGLALTFDFSQLRVYMKLDTELPAYQKLQRKLARDRLHQDEAALRDVRYLPLRRELFNGGVADWTLSANPLGRDQYYDLTVGSQLLGGDLMLAGSGNTINGIDRDQLSYRWHYYIQENPYVSQVDLGELFTVGPLARTIEGVMLTNRPQVQRNFFQTIRLEGAPGPGWEVELYVDNRLTDFTETDQAGEYTFNLDIVYGSSLITIKLYGPNGEIRTEEQYIRIPYTLIPRGTIEYTIAAGKSTNNRERGTFGQATGYYGLLENLTLGVSGDLPVVKEDSSQALVATDLTFQPMGNLAVNTSVSPRNEMALSVNYSKPSVISLSASATRYFENPIRNLLEREYSLNFSVTAPLRVKGKYFGLRYNVLYEVQPIVKITNMTYGWSASLTQFQVNYLGRYKISQYATRRTTDLESQFIASIRMVRWIQPQLRVDYDHSENSLKRYGLYLSKRFLRTGQATLSLEHLALTNSNQISLALNFFTDFVDVSSRVTRAHDNINWSQIQRGSVRYNEPTGSVQFRRRSGVGYGSAVVRPFLDANYNGHYDSGEEFLPGLRARLKGASGNRSRQDRSFSYDNLRAYDEYLVQIDPYSLDNPLLKPTHENYKVTVPPNMVTEIQVPIVTAAEVTGRVERETELGTAGIGGVRVVLYNISRETVTEITTFNDGEFYYLGLLPGTYRAYIDPGQLERYNYTADPPSHEFTVEPIAGGAVIDAISFVLHHNTSTDK